MNQKQINHFLKEKSKSLVIGHTIKRRIPIIECWIIDEIHVSFYCPYCKKNHLHGIGDGHRCSHCSNQKSEFKELGYILKCKGDLRK